MTAAIAVDEHRAGDLAYVDCFSGMVPCRVLMVEENMTYGHGAMVTVVVTADRGAYRRGERLWVSASQVVPRDQVRRVRGSGQLRIRGGYAWVAS